MKKIHIDSPIAPYGFLVSTAAWRRLDLDNLDPTAPYSTAAPRVRMARTIAARMNETRDLSAPDTQPARAGEILTMGLVTRVLRHIAVRYCVVAHPGIIDDGLDHARHLCGDNAVDATLPEFTAQFAPESVRRAEIPPKRWLAGLSDDLPHLYTAVIETLLLQVSSENPALEPYRELHDPAPLRAAAPFDPYMGALELWFATQPPFAETGLVLLETLRAPAKASPHSLDGQLEFILRQWRAFIPEELFEELLVARGVLREETAMRGFGPGPSVPLSFADHDAYSEPEGFTPDKDWMPNVVLIAKSAYVWLDQLSKKHKRPIERLDQIPDVELDLLAHWGFNALWLIGLWERSGASRDIKRRMGNSEAEASAYSLYDYDIAADLGGEAGYHALAERAWRRGIRLASDMVPNHMGLYSRWVVEHPDWFMQLSEPPFPGYTFNGLDLSPDPRVGLFIEDGYWNRTDAAVVFKRLDRWTGEVRYIYHGNDGTNMPWNDTAQLNFMLPEVREAVIQTILHVARRSPIIRFDAAMTLAKKHYQRLWFPKPGEGGAIPSRAERGMSREEFDHVFPEEFWRQVVDRIAAEAPNTLLLAEAFWLMEGYFVRTLGMHRVYNSAFMNMLKMEDNAKYRQTIKNVLEFSPEVLQRFVNFMNNPDEDTAEAQFGRGDKYFGAAALLATMPGLPMFGHGQIEGFTEKYGMEYRRAYLDESPDANLIARHEREIFPLVRRRHVFSGARHFAFYDFVTPEGWVDENVFAYSNRDAGERGLIVYNNGYGVTRGVVHTSTAINEGSVENKSLRRLTLAEALDLDLDSTAYVIFQDARTGLEYLHHAPTLAERGLHAELRGYEYQALIDWCQLRDFDNSWGRLHAELAGRGVPSVGDAYLEMNLAALLGPFRELVAPDSFALLSGDTLADEDWQTVEDRLAAFLEAVRDKILLPGRRAEVLRCARKEVDTLRELREHLTALDIEPTVLAALLEGMPEEGFPLDYWRVPFAVALLRPIGLMAAPGAESLNQPGSKAVGTGPLPAIRPAEPVFDVAATSSAWMREWFLTRQIARSFQEMSPDAWRADMDARLVRIAVAHDRYAAALGTEIWAPLLDHVFQDPDVRVFLMENRFGGHRYVNKEQLERLCAALPLSLAADWLSRRERAGIAPLLEQCQDDLHILADATADAGYDLDGAIEGLI